VRHALLTVFSDILRYQNLLCRYDTYALKCQDIFSVHGFPVGLVQCENNLLGIPTVGSGSFRHFVEKYRRAKAYCRAPFETHWVGSRKQQIQIKGERIGATLVDHVPEGPHPQAHLACAPSASLDLPPESLDGVFTDPPYFANVQYAELMDFCYVWLRQSLAPEIAAFQPETTRNGAEVTGNITQGRDLTHFSEGLSAVFCRYAAALKPGAPFVFTYHHNDPEAYAPLVMALLDARLFCTAVLPTPAEMEASLHINNTGSSILDSVFVARREALPTALPPPAAFRAHFLEDCRKMVEGGVKLSQGDAQCIMSGHIARLSVQSLWADWVRDLPATERLDTARAALQTLATRYNARAMASETAQMLTAERTVQQTLFDLEAVRAPAV
jgi:adenine-specific DNA methylase